MLFTMKVDLEDAEKIERASKLVNAFSLAAQHHIVNHYGVLHLVKENIKQSDLKAVDGITNMQSNLPNPCECEGDERRLISLKHEILSAWHSDVMLGIMKHAIGSEALVEKLAINQETMVEDIQTMDKYGMRKAAELMRYKVARAMSMD